MKKLLFYSDFLYALIVIKQAHKKTLKPLIFSKISGLKIWSSGNFFVTLKV